MKVLSFVFCLFSFIQFDAQEIKFGYYVNQYQTKDIEILSLSEAAEIRKDLNINPNDLMNSFYFSMIDANGIEKIGFGYFNNLYKIYDIKFKGENIGVHVLFRTDEFIEIYTDLTKEGEVFKHIPDDIALNKDLIPYVNKVNSEVYFRFIKGELKGKLLFIEGEKTFLLNNDDEILSEIIKENKDKLLSEEEEDEEDEEEDELELSENDEEMEEYEETFFCVRIQDSLNTRFKRYFFENSYGIDAEDIVPLENLEDTSYTVKFNYFKNQIYLINNETDALSIGQLGEGFYYKDAAKLAKMDSISRRLFLARFVFEYNDSIKLYLMEKNEFQTDEMDAYLVKNENTNKQESFLFTVKKVESSTPTIYVFRYSQLIGKKLEYIELRVREPSCIFDFSENCKIKETFQILKNQKVPMMRVQ